MSIKNGNSEISKIYLGSTEIKKIYLGNVEVYTSNQLWTPAQIATTVWLDADDSNTITLNGSTVSQWSDKSGNNRHAVQTLPADQPIYSPNTINGKPVLNLAQDWLQIDSAGMMTGQNWDVFTIASLESTSDLNGRLLSGLIAGGLGQDFNNTDTWVIVGRDSNLARINNMHRAVNGGIYNVSYSTPYIINSIFTPTLISLNVDGVRRGTPSTTVGSLNIGRINIGRWRVSERWVGNIGELIIAPLLTTDNRLLIEGYLAHKWGLQSRLPDVHPFKVDPPLVGFTFGPDLLANTYPARAVYSLRKVNKYFRFAIRVRRSTDNAEQNIGFVGNDLDTASLLSFVGAGDGFVTTWYDQSGNGVHLTNTITAQQPRIVLAGSLETLNGKPAVKYDGSNDCLFNTTFSAGLTGISAYTVNSYSVAPGSVRSIFITPVNATPPTVTVFELLLTDLAGYFDVGSSFYPQNGRQIGFNTVKTAGSQMLFFENYNGLGQTTISNYTMSLDGASQTVALGGTLGYVPEYLSVGGRSQQQLAMFSGHVQEVAFYQSDQSANQSAIQSNINSYYNIY